MTLIAVIPYKKGFILAADRAICIDDSEIVMSKIPKIEKINGALLGGAGDANFDTFIKSKYCDEFPNPKTLDISTLSTWCIKTGNKYRELLGQDSNFSGILACELGLFIVDANGLLISIDAPFTDGSGNVFAKGILEVNPTIDGLYQAFFLAATKTPYVSKTGWDYASTVDITRIDKQKLKQYGFNPLD